MKSYKKLILVLFLFLLGCSSRNSSKCIEGDCENGHGTRQWNDKGLEKGQWKNGELNGKGFQYFGSSSDFAGDTYTGNFKDGQYNGHGTYYDKSEDSQYVGNWKNGKPNGKGIGKWGKKSKYPNRYYSGEYKNGLMHGYGTKFWGIAEEDKFTNNKYTD